MHDVGAPEREGARSRLHQRGEDEERPRPSRRPGRCRRPWLVPMGAMQSRCGVGAPPGVGVCCGHLQARTRTNTGKCMRNLYGIRRGCLPTPCARSAAAARPARAPPHRPCHRQQPGAVSRPQLPSGPRTGTPSRRQPTRRGCASCDSAASRAPALRRRFHA